MGKRKKSLTAEEIEKLHAGIEEVRGEVQQLIAFLQAKLGQKPAS